jgi:hypothetical protein
MQKTRWRPFPYDGAAYEFAGAALRKSWPRLHQGDRESFPDQAYLKKLIAAHRGLAPAMPIDAAASALQDAWRAYHKGAFGEAMEAGLALGPLGYDVANKACNIYATYLETDDQSRLALFQQVIRRAEGLQSCAPSLSNAWYFHGQALGRYSQAISVAEALAEGLAGKVRHSLERAIALDPQHADARIALGAYHAEIIAKVGSMIGSLTYGASKEAGVENFEAALRLNPHSAIARIEYANALVMMFGRERMRQATRLYEEAAASVPADAMERLDAELAKAEIER